MNRAGAARPERIVVIVVGHGSPPRDIPSEKIAEYMRLEKRAKMGDERAREGFERLDREIRRHPRTPENDPYFYGVAELVDELEKNPMFAEVIAAFNEFCDPTVEEAIERAVSLKPELIVVVPTMITKGGEHSEEDIPKKIEKAAKKLGKIRVVYAWPFETKLIADFLSRHVQRFISEELKAKTER